MTSAPSVPRLAQSAAFLLFVLAFSAAPAQKPAHRPECGKTVVSIADATLLTFSDGVIAIELPSGWVRDESKSNPFFLLRAGDHYESARTLMYIHVQDLDGSFEQAVKRDQRDFLRNDHSAQILDDPPLEVLEKGCPVKTQRFLYRSNQKNYIDQVTKIGINGLLLNVVLSSERSAEIARYENDYEFLLKHIGLVMHTR